MITASIVVFHTSKEELAEILSCTLQAPIAKVFVIDNSFNDELRDYILSFSAKIIYIWGQGNIGYGSAHNIAMKKTFLLGADYHIILNPDIYFEKNVIGKCHDYMEQNTKAGAIMPKVEYPNGEIQYLCKLLPTPFNLIIRRFLCFNIFQRYQMKYELKHSGYNKIMNVPCLSGCFMFLRVSLFGDIGYFDERYFMYGEDFDYYRRIHQKYETIFYPIVTIIHKHKKESYKNVKMLVVHIKSMICYFNKWGWFWDKERRSVNRRILNEISQFDKHL